MKTGIHPEYMVTKVHCNSCDTKFETRSTVPSIDVEICSVCHPFYTGKQKLIDTAGRVDRFKALRDQAAKLKADAKPKKERKPSNAVRDEEVVAAPASKKADKVVEKIEEEFEAETVDLPQANTTPEATEETPTDTTES